MRANTNEPLKNVAAVLNAMATGTVPNRQVLSGALALSTLCMRGTPDRELIDAAAGLDALATGRQLELNAEGRARSAILATRVRRELASQS